MNKTEIAYALVLLAVAAVIWLTMIFWPKHEEKQARRCQYCTYWFECSSMTGGRCDKHSTAKQPFYTQPNDVCKYYDGFAEED